tara:strand:- start:69 stop:410 length:342 start_codon:yes stop_codon:yes gene_type:complete
MIILQKSTGSQTINFIPRSYTEGLTYTIKITDETTSSEIFSSTSTSFTSNDYYYQYSSTFTLKEDTMYNLEIKQGSTLIFRDRVFCTNQTISNYSINDSAYTEQSQTNEFIVL